MRLCRSVTLCLMLVAGCGPAVSREDLGTVVDEVPEVEGADRPYEMPELDEPAPAQPEPIQLPETPD